MRWRTKIFLDFSLVAKRGRIRIINQHPRAGAHQEMRKQGQSRFHRLWFCRAGVEIVRHRDHGEQDADHTQQGQQRDARFARTSTREP